MKLIKWWGPVVIWMLVIFFFSSRQKISVSPEELINFLFFKTLHVLEYAALYFFVYRALKNSYKKWPPAYWAMWTFILVILYATSDEMHQVFVASREGRARDVIIDTIGATLAWISIEQLLPRMPKRLQKLAANWLSI